MPVRPYCVAVCGLMGSGKTTLARGLARAFNWSYIPMAQPATQYLSDLFKNTERWAFEAQAAFLIYRSLNFQEALQEGRGIILDRSLAEDINIFARHFYERGDIDPRSYETYLALAHYFQATLPSPDLTILCDCPLGVIKERMASRGRDFQRLYPPNHLERLKVLYDEWRENFEDSDVFSVDTLSIDTRNPSVANSIAEDIAMILNSRDGAVEQLDLFASNSGRGGDLAIITPVKLARSFRDGDRKLIRLAASSARTLNYPAAYIAAPFTAQASPSEPIPGLLFESLPVHGVIKPSRFRRMLIGVDRELRRMGIEGFLPHRDINKWGRRKLTAEQVADLCGDYVREADVFIAIPGLSHGSHYELGLALGLGKPTLVVHCDEIPNSFISAGITSKKERLLVVHCKSVRQVPALVKSIEVKNFLGRHVPISWGDLSNA